MSVPLGPLTQNVFNSIGEMIPLTSSSTTSSRGVLNLSITVPSIYDAACGWFTRIYSAGCEEFESLKVWVILSKNFISFYESPFGGEACLIDRINCQTIAEISEIVFNRSEIKVGAFELSFLSTEERVVLVAAGTSSIKEFWHRALVHQILFGSD